jgi:uncharacterized repeat protein (TIGR01451 family)
MSSKAREEGLMRAKSGVLSGSILTLLSAIPALAVTTTDLSSITPQQLAQLLAGPGVTVSNVTFTGATVAGGSFSGGLADGLGIDSGVILSSGDIANAVGPNNNDGVTGFNKTPGDPSLNAIVGETHQTFDAAVLEFDFVPSSNTVSFRYVFASDEYNEFVGFFNDVFAFFIDGQNVALIPGTTTPVAINTVNLQTNPSFYRNNDPSDLGTPTPFGTQFDGFTTVLTATATLTPNVSHHIKLAIADTDDFNLDSAVFLQAASFVSQTLTVSKSAPASVASGSDFTYTVTYGNPGNTAVSNVVITDPLPAGVTFVSATAGGQLSEGGLVTWNVGTVGAGVTGQTVSFTVHVTATSGNITNSNYPIQGTGVSQVTGSSVTTAVTGGGGGCPTITLSPASLPGGEVGVAYSQSIAASGGAAPITFRVVSGTPPPGLSLSSSGVLAGTPTDDGTFSFTVRATDANECTGSRSYVLTITSGGCAVTLSQLFDGFVGVPYERTIQANGGSPPFGFSLTSGSLPPGLTLSSGGVVSGTPTTAGSFTFSVRAVDSNQCVGSRTYTLTVSCPFATISPPVLPSASQGVAYAQTLTVIQNGTRPYTFAVTEGALPSGVTLSSGGSLAGTPTDAGNFSFTVTATDPNGCTARQAYVLAVCTALTIAPETLPAATVGAPFTATVVASGGTAPYSYAQSGLPTPLTLNASSGAISGTPAALGTFNVAVTATDVNGCPGAKDYVLKICPLLALSPSSLEEGAVGVPYPGTFVASGGTAPYTYTSTGLPPGVGLSSAGDLAGVPTAAGTFNATVTAVDATGCAVSRSYTIRVTDAPPRITDLTLTPAGDGFTLTINGSGFTPGAMVFVDGVAYPAIFVSPTQLTVNLPASAIPATGSINVSVTNPGPTGGTSNPATLTFCSPPGAPRNPTITPFGNPTGPVTATDFLVVSWDPPASGPAPTSYEFRINGDPYTIVAGGTSAIVPPRGSNDPITLHVRAHCNADVAGPEVASATYSLAPPVADFTFSAARVGSPVVFTDTSSPQATSWFWIFDDGATSTIQSPTHTFTTPGTHQVALIATNGSGSSQRIKEVVVSASAAAGTAAPSSARFFAATGRGRWTLADVRISEGRPAWLAVRSTDAAETIVYLRFLEADGRVALERRLSVSAGEAATNDVGAYGLVGTFTLEVVAGGPIAAVLAEPGKSWAGGRLEEDPR